MGSKKLLLYLNTLKKKISILKLIKKSLNIKKAKEKN